MLDESANRRLCIFINSLDNVGNRIKSRMRQGLAIYPNSEQKSTPLRHKAPSTKTTSGGLWLSVAVSAVGFNFILCFSFLSGTPWFGMGMGEMLPDVPLGFAEARCERLSLAKYCFNILRYKRRFDEQASRDKHTKQ